MPLNFNDLHYQGNFFKVNVIYFLFLEQAFNITSYLCIINVNNTFVFRYASSASTDWMSNRMGIQHNIALLVYNSYNQ